MGRDRRPPIELTPSLILSFWAAGLAAACGLVVCWKIVGPGFVWLTGSVAAALATIAAITDPNPMVVLGVALVLTGVFLAREPAAAPALWASAAVLVAVAARDGGYLSSAAGAAFLGGVTAEMLLGHWYLVDPRLPRWALFRLAAGAGIALVAEAGLLITDGVLGGDDSVLVVAFAVMTSMVAVLLVAVWFALRERGYPAVMAATGLSYLAVLMALGVSVVGRVVLDVGGTV